MTGVIAFERPGFDDTKKFRWDELGAVVARKLGSSGAWCIAHADWETDTHDEEAVYIAFDVPGVPEDYLDSYRNMIEPVTPENAPSDEDFRVRDRARKIIMAAKPSFREKSNITDHPALNTTSSRTNGRGSTTTNPTPPTEASTMPCLRSISKRPTS